MSYKYITLVSNNSTIFTGSIKDNLKMGKEDATAEEMINACKVAGLANFIHQLPQGLDTNVGVRGTMLSGGQRQRLALARALLYDTEILVFDEATSNVDVESENAIWEAIYELAKTKTILIISHRLSTVKAADCIFVMQDGRIVEEGKHPELMQKKGVYRHLVESQMQYETFGKGENQYEQ